MAYTETDERICCSFVTTQQRYFQRNTVANQETGTDRWLKGNNLLRGENGKERVLNNFQVHSGK